MGAEPHVPARPRKRSPESWGSTDRLGRIYGWIANAHRNMQDYEPALAYCQRAHVMATALGDSRPPGLRHIEMGRIYLALGDYRQAMAYLQQT